MTAIVRNSHRIYKRYQSQTEAAIAAGGLALLVGIVLAKMPVYPPHWSPVIIAVVALVGFQWPLAAYLLATIALLYPVYTLSLYLAVLYLAITIICHRPASHYLGATVLILAAPLLAKYHLHWTIPILAGLWWGSVNGFWIGAAAALWGKLLAGMAGLDIDWLLLQGQSISMAGIMQRFNGIGSLETLGKLFQPLAPDTTLLLYHLLQVAMWALVAGFVGALANQKWIYHRYPWSTLLVSALGSVLLGLSHLFLTFWLKGTDLTILNYEPLLVVAVAGLIISSTLEVLRQALELPVAPVIYRRRGSVPHERVALTAAPVIGQSSQPSTAANQASRRPTPIPLPDLPEWEPPDDENNDLILLELD